MSLVDTKTYKRWRSPEVNELELCVWSADMFKYAISASYESYGSLKTAIRRGVPDVIKQYIWIKANGADRFYAEHSNFYKHSFTTTFGLNVPETMGEDCPTFCGGILGLQSDILGTPVRARDLDFDSSSLGTDSLSASVYTWGRTPESSLNRYTDYDPLDYEPLPRHLSVSSLREDYDKRRPKLISRHMASMDDGSIARVRSDYGIRDELKQVILPDVIEESCEFDRGDSIDQYLSVLHAENRNQQILLRSTKKKIRERHRSAQEGTGAPLKGRQYSHNLLNTGNASLPSPPKHHRELLGDHAMCQGPGSYDTLSPKACMIIQMLRKRENKPKLKATDVRAPRRGVLQGFVKWIAQRCGIRKDVGEHLTTTKTVVFGDSMETVITPEIDDMDNSFSAIQEMNRSYHATGSMTPIDEPEFTDHGYYIFPSSPADNALVRQATKRVLHTSVYKLSDVTDFTTLLTARGVDEVKRILWCLNTSFSSKIEFLPIIPSLCCLLLVYMAPDAVLCVLHCLMVKAVKTGALECGERFLFVHREGFINFVKYVHSVMKYHLRKLVAKMQLLNVDIAAWIARSAQSGFSHLLPFDFILRIYGDFLFEGEIVLCRYCVALIKYAQGKLMKCNTQDEAEETLYRIGLDPELDIDQLTKLAYSFRLKYYKSEVKGGTTTPYLMPVKIKTFYRPRLASVSKIVMEHKWEAIWAWLLPAYRILDPQMVYSSDKHGTTLLGLIKAIKDTGRSGVAALLFIETTTSDIFGVFIPTLNCEAIDGLFTPQKTSDQHSSFVFTLKPDEEIYKWSGQNTSGVKLGLQQIVVGNDMPAFMLDKTMNRGLSQECMSYNSPSLVSTANGYFDVRQIELWQLV